MNDQPNTITAALREAADLLEQHPDLPHAPYVTSSSRGTVHLAWYLPLPHYTGPDLAKQKADAATIVRAIGGTWDKPTPVESSQTFNFTQKRGLLSFTVQVDRPAVCERVVVGTEERTVPAVEARPERTETVEKVRWECRPLLADDQAATAEAVA